ncbi:hypothetical protein FOA52_003431 [Chlamydomonas sp. UWO 241]|nr:hypothetical protein FOA52_003431 [Chlamydomonas sp. UWO 241]
MDPSAGVRVKAPKVPNIAIAARPSLPVEKPVLPGFARARTASTSSVARRCNAPTSADPSASTAAGGCGASDGATPTRSGYDDLPQAGPSAPSAAGASGSASRGSAGGSAWGWRRGPGGAVGEGTEGDGGDSDDGGDAVSGWARSRLRDGLDSPPEPEPAGRQPTAEQQQQQQAAWLRGEAARTPSASSPARAAAAGPLGGARDPDANDPDAASREGDLPGHIVSPTGGGPTTSAGRTTPLRGSSTPSGDNPRGASPGTPSASLGAYGSPATPPPPHHQSQSSRAAPAAPAPAGAPSNDLPGDGTWRKLPYDSVLFYHGLNGMQLACESGKVAPGTCILFNGATLLHEQFHEMLDNADQFMKHDPDGKDGPAPAVNVDYEIPDLVDMEMWRRYCTLVQVFQIYTGVYIQEPDASAPAVCAIIQLCNSHPGFFPLGFAYGHLSTKAVAVAGHEGRGLANQALLEELNSREKLGGKVCKWISMGVHLGASDDVYISWGRRVLYGPRLMDLGPQQLLLQLLADYPDEDRLPVIVNAMGGLEKIFLRFFNHYDAHSAFTLWELGFNFNYTKALLRLLRNRNYMALMDHDAKLSFVRLLLTPPRTGDRSTSRKTHYVGRGDMHKLCKEAVLCMFESCTSAELTKLIEEVGGLPFIHRRLRGWLKIQGRNYVHRLGAVLEFHWSQPEQAAFKHVSYGYVTYARPPELDLTTHNQWWDFLDLVRDDEIVMVDGVPVTVDTRRTRPKGAAFKFMRLFIKVLAWLYTVCWNVLLTACCPLWMCCCLPTLCAPYCRGIWIPLAIATGLVVVLYLLQVGAVIGGVTASEAGGGGEDPLEIDQHLRMRRLMEAAAVALLGGDGGGGALTEE